MIRASGKEIAQILTSELQETISACTHDIVFRVIYVGSDAVIENFMKKKYEYAQKLGVQMDIVRFEDDITTEALVQNITELSESSHAMIVQLPLPEHIDVQVVLDAVPSEQDVDVLGSEAFQEFQQGASPFIPPVAGAIVEVLNRYEIEMVDQNIVVIGNGKLVGKPITAWLDQHDFSYVLMDRDTDPLDFKYQLQDADIIISGAGSPGVVTPGDVKDGVVLIDAGTSESGKKILGDIDTDCYDRASLYTPVPGGIGPLTIAILYRNVVATCV